MSSILTEVLVIVALIVANGMLSLAEFAVISARKYRLRGRAIRGDRGARVALELADNSREFLATIQVGITLVATVAGVFAGGTLARELMGLLGRSSALAPYAEVLGTSAVVLGITVATVVLGELVPKRLALSRPESLAALMARPIRAFSWLVMPPVRLLSGATDVVLRPLGVRPSSEPTVTHEDVKGLVQEGTRAGVFREAENEMFLRVFRFCDRRAKTLMTPRGEIVWIDVSDSPGEIHRKVSGCPHSRFPVCDQSLDNVIGIVHVKDLLAKNVAGEPMRIKGLLTMPHFLYDGTRGLIILETFRKSSVHTAIVLDEYGAVVGLLTLKDVLEAILGELPETVDEEDEERAVQRGDGSWLLDGRLTMDEFRDIFDFWSEPQGDYQTLAGLVVTELGHIPRVAETFERGGLFFEVVDMDANRVDRVLVRPAPSGSATR
jgi:putative hemolysin